MVLVCLFGIIGFFVRVEIGVVVKVRVSDTKTVSVSVAVALVVTVKESESDLLLVSFGDPLFDIERVLVSEFKSLADSDAEDVMVASDGVFVSETVTEIDLELVAHAVSVDVCDNVFVIECVSVRLPVCVVLKLFEA
jgi:hypothetical protein